MRIACVGKGGSGKTTLAALVTQFLLQQKRPVLAIDADINQHLAFALGLDQTATQAIPDLGNHLDELKTILKGDNTLIRSVKGMIKTSLPGPGSHILHMDPHDPVLNRFSYCDHDNLYFVRTGGFQSDDIGIRCFHAKTGGTELVLNHLADAPSEWTIIDMTAGADAFASGLFTRFDVTCVIVEPTIQSVSVFEQYRKYAEDYNIRLCVIGNKIQSQDDADYLHRQCGDALIGCIPSSSWINKKSRGEPVVFQDIEQDVTTVLKALVDFACLQTRDWKTYWQWGVHFHRKNALSWGNSSAGEAVEDWYDPEFLNSFNDGLTPIEKQAAGQHAA